VFGASVPTTTATTPSSASARLVSIRLIRACGYGECRIFPISIPGTLRSSVYLPAPVVLPAASIIATRLPIIEKSLFIGLLSDLWKNCHAERHPTEHRERGEQQVRRLAPTQLPALLELPP